MDKSDKSKSASDKSGDGAFLEPKTDEPSLLEASKSSEDKSIYPISTNANKPETVVTSAPKEHDKSDKSDKSKSTSFSGSLSTDETKSCKSKSVPSKESYPKQKIGAEKQHTKLQPQPQPQLHADSVSISYNSGITFHPVPIKSPKSPKKELTSIVRKPLPEYYQAMVFGGPPQAKVSTSMKACSPKVMNTPKDCKNHIHNPVGEREGSKVYTKPDLSLISKEGDPILDLPPSNGAANAPKEEDSKKTEDSE